MSKNNGNRWRYILILLFVFLIWSLLLFDFSDMDRILGNSGNTNDSNHPKTNNYITDDDIPLDIFAETEYWTSRDRWDDLIVDMYNGKIEDSKFVIDENKKFAHFAKKFQNSSFKFANISIKIIDGNSSGKLNIASSGLTEKRSMAHLDYSNEDIDVKRSFDLKNGTNEIDLGDIDWKGLTFFKVVLYRKSVEIQSPELNKIDLG
ncbi:MAG: hypothetical protein ABEK36_01090 [Candidatus Aenigmatarchaeota archaeon]